MRRDNVQKEGNSLVTDCMIFTILKGNSSWPPILQFNALAHEGKLEPAPHGDWNPSPAQGKTTPMPHLHSIGDRKELSTLSIHDWAKEQIDTAQWRTQSNDRQFFILHTANQSDELESTTSLKIKKKMKEQVAENI